MSLATDTNTGAVIDSVAARFAAQDEARMRELDERIRATSDERYARDTPLCMCGCLAPRGKCAAKAPSVQTSAPAEPAAHTETTMACPECKSPTCHKKTCSRRASASADAAPKAPLEPAAAKPSVVATAGCAAGKAVAARIRARAELDLEDLDGAALRALRADLRKQLEDVEKAIRERADKLEAERRELLAEIGDEAA